MRRRVPRISVVLPTANRAALLRLALEALTGQSVPRTAFEVIVVDDGSTDATPEVARAFDDRLALSYVRQAQGGISRAKNLALTRATAPIVLFLDDDDVADPDLLAEHLATHARHDGIEVAVLGYTSLTPELRALPIMHYVTEVGANLFSYGRIRDGDVLDYTYFWGGRSSCKRELLLRHGEFNPVFEFGSEDIELGYRLSAAGLRVIYNERARSTMVRPLTLAQFLSRVERQGRSASTFGRLHPVEKLRVELGLTDLERRWARWAGRYGAVVTAARDLDRIALARLAQALELDAAFIALLHHAYRTAIDCAWLKGAAEENARMDRQVDVSVR